MLMCDALTLVGIRGYDKLEFSKLQESEKRLESFKQSMTLEELKYKNSKLTGDEKLTPDEVEMILDFEDESSRMGNFSRVFPLESNVVQFEKYFEVKRY